MKLAMTNFSMKYPRAVLAGVALITIFFVMQFPKVAFDNDPENMLAENEHVRVFHHKVKERFKLYDFVIAGVVNEEHADGAFNTQTLGNIHRLTHELLSLKQGQDGKPVVTRVSDAGSSYEETIDMSSKNAWRRVLDAAFKHKPNNLFEEDGSSAIVRDEVISPSVVDNITQAELGSLKLEYLMERAPVSEEEALGIKKDAMSNPLYQGTLVSEDGKAICVYIPIKSKTYSHNVANLVKELTKDWEGNDKLYITGLPVAEDTFGIEMLVQMATSAPMAGLVIFLLLLLFFRKLSLIIAPMLLAVVSVLCTMGLLIGLGFKVHIMSSMIAIFLMPIAVADSVHILSEFFDTYHKFRNKVGTMQHVIGHLFMPMLYTSLTTMAGFGSLVLTPIPPVRIFGAHVAFGVGLAWLLTMTLVPAYVMVAVPQKSLNKLRSGDHDEDTGVAQSPLMRGLEWLGLFAYRRWKAIMMVTVGILVISVMGISRIRVNDNPVKWFTSKHPIRVADRVLNKHFGGTYTAYLTLSPVAIDKVGCDEKAAVMVAEAKQRFGKRFPEETTAFIAKLTELKQVYKNVRSSDVRKCFVDLANACEELDEKATGSWNNLADAVNYLDTDGLTLTRLERDVRSTEGVEKADIDDLLQQLDQMGDIKGEVLLEAALAICESAAGLSFRSFVFEMEAELTAPPFKRPEVLRYVKTVQEHLKSNPVVGKTSSAVDALEKAAYELNYVAPPADANQDEIEAFAARNEANWTIPDSAAGVGQVFFQLENMKKKDALFHLVTKDYREANIWVQLKRGDNRDMEAVVKAMEDFLIKSPAPIKIDAGWAGLTYLNVVWQEKMVWGMSSALVSSFVVVLIMMMVLFRSPLYGLLSMIPLSVTILFIYGLIGIVGKDYDMPVAVLSALTLGLSVDFAIHFLQRARELQREKGSWKEASRQMFKEPAMAISRNAIIISVGFTPLLMAPLVPYRTVGFFLATIMVVSWAATLLLLSAMLTAWQSKMFESNSD